VEEMPMCGGCGERFAAVDADDLCPDCAEAAAVCDRCEGTGIPDSGPMEGRCGSCHGTGAIKKETVPYEA
jgi:DnaJ-class molecular chaperone